MKERSFIDFMLERILETIRTRGVLTNVPINIPINVPINVPINEAVLDLVRQQPGINRTKMAELLGVDVKTIGRALITLKEVEHRGSKKTGGYFLK